MRLSRNLLLAALFALLVACSSSADTRQQSPNFKEGRFENTVPRGDQVTLGKLVKAFREEDWGNWPEEIPNTNTPELATEADREKAVLTFINHSTFLLEAGGQRIIFDPIFSSHAGWLGRFGIKRHRAPALPLADLPNIDVVAISHNHYDHLDLPTLKFLDQRDKPLFLVPLGDKRWLKTHLDGEIKEFDWYQNHEAAGCFRYSFVPTQHSSGRGLFDREASFWGGWVIEHRDLTLFHAGDTGYSAHFADIGRAFNVDIALLPIGAWKPRWLLNYVHMDPEQAIRAHHDLEANTSLGMHYETFPLTALSYGEAMEEFIRQRDQAELSPQEFRTLAVGESWRIPLSEPCVESLSRVWP